MLSSVKVKKKDTVVFRVMGEVFEGMVCGTWTPMGGYWVVEAEWVPRKMSMFILTASVELVGGRWAVHESEMVVTS